MPATHPSTQLLLQNFVTLTDFLGRALGPDYEVALHDLTDERQTLIAIANNHVSGRSLGSPLTDLALKLIEDYPYDTADYRLNYRGLSASGKILRCSTMFIKNDIGELIGLLCINFDNSRYQELSEKLLGLCHPDVFIETNFLFDQQRVSSIAEATDVEHFVNAESASPAAMVHKVKRELGITSDTLLPKEKSAVIAELKRRGVFNIKSAVKDVAEQLDLSPASIYRHLSK